MTVYESPRELYATWESPTVPNGIITSYSVYCFESFEPESGSGSGSGRGVNPLLLFSDSSAASDVHISTVNGSELETTITDLIPYTIYDCYVTANTSAGESDPSRTKSTRTDEAGK